jgi:molybdenum cofactor biosynthesis enzyme MoaA
VFSTVCILVGDGSCNARCKHCSGLDHRGPNVLDDADLVRRVLRENKSTALSICGAGEPTLLADDVTKLLRIIRGEKIGYEKIKLYTNGIRVGEDEEFMETLWLWESLGLTDVYLTVHSFDEAENARIFGIPSYPNLRIIFDRIREVGFRLRANLVLIKGRVDTAEKLAAFVKLAVIYGADNVVAWPKRGLDDEVDTEISSSNMEAMAALGEGLPVCVYWPPRESTDKICLFPDGELRDSWCK